MKGTTPTHTFTIPFDTSKVDKVKIIYAQDDVVVLEKRTSDCTLLDNTIKVTLAQEDTFRFDHEKAVEIQIRVLTNDDKAFKSLPYVVGVTKCLDDEVL